LADILQRLKIMDQGKIHLPGQQDCFQGLFDSLLGMETNLFGHYTLIFPAQFRHFEIALSMGDPILGRGQ